MKVLVTNDDSHASPLLHFLITYLESKVELTVVAPRFEQSWKGKAVTRFEPLTIEPIEVVGFPVTTVDGSPADCANIGIHHICPEPPNLIISGINAGQNAGAGFVFSSGTVGACLEANIAGIPALALSQHLDWNIMSGLRKGDILPDDIATRLRDQAEKILDKIFQVIQEHETLLEQAVTYNINFPFVLNETFSIVPAPVGHNFYGSLFSKTTANTLNHDLRVITRDARPRIDASVIEAGDVSISVLDIRNFGQMDAATMGALSRIF